MSLLYFTFSTLMHNYHTVFTLLWNRSHLDSNVRYTEWTSSLCGDQGSVYCDSGLINLKMTYIIKWWCTMPIRPSAAWHWSLLVHRSANVEWHEKVPYWMLDHINGSIVKAVFLCLLLALNDMTTINQLYLFINTLIIFSNLICSYMDSRELNISTILMKLVNRFDYRTIKYIHYSYHWAHGNVRQIILSITA